MKTTVPLLEVRAFRRLDVRSCTRLLAALWVVGGATLHAQEKLVAEYPWKTLADQGKVEAALVREEPGHGAVCTISNPQSQPLRKTLLTLDAPAITTDFYRLAGEIRYDGVEGGSYLEMWSTFPPATPGGSERSYFSRTLAEENQMGKIHGTSDWREFSVPFNATGSGAHPSRLTFNLVLAGKGTVGVGGMKLWQSTGFGAVGSAGSWMGRFAGNGAWPLLVSLGACGVCGGIVVAAVKRRQRSRESEARRMAARDILA